MRKNRMLIAGFIGLIGLSACGIRLKNTSIPHELNRDTSETGWKLFEDVGFNPTIEISKLELVSFLTRDDGTYIGGEEMAKRARDVFGANLGQFHIAYLLEHQNEIPTEWREYVPVFPGTKWRDSRGDLRVPCLFWDSDRWCLGFRWLVGHWGSNSRLVRPSK